MSEEQEKLREKIQNNFMVEKIKERPINKRKLIIRTLTTAFMAVMFGTIACVTFILFEPIISNKLNPKEEPNQIIFPEDKNEMSPEEMLSENMQQENQNQQQSQVMDEEEIPVLEEQIQEILDGIVLGKENYEQIYSSLSQYVKELNRFMVTITGVSSNVDWFNSVQESRNQTSGVILANNGLEFLIVTDYTKLNNSDSLNVTFSDGTLADAALKQYDEITGLAIIAVRLDDLPDNYEESVFPATMGSSNYNNLVGTPVIAIGNPMGTTGSIGYGVIVSISGQMTDVDTNYKLLQTNIAGSRNAGGAIFNLQGQFIGIITNGKGSTDMQNLVSAYGISEMRPKLQKMSNGEKMAYLGITGMDVTYDAHKNLNVPYGAYVYSAEMDSPAMLAGIRQGDVIIKMGKSNISSFGEYVVELLQHKPGDNINIIVMRQNQVEYTQVEFNVVLE